MKKKRPTQGEYQIKKTVFESKEKKDEDMVQIYCLLNGERVLNKTFVPVSQAKDFQLKKEIKP